MERLISGDIYIKREPDYIKFTDNEIEEIEMEKEIELKQVATCRKKMKELGIKKFHFTGAKLEEFLSGVNAQCDIREKEIYEIEKELLEKGKAVYDRYKNFWVLSLTEEGLTMVEQSNGKKASKITYKNPEEMNKNFVSLRETLQNAEFFGKEYFVGNGIGNVFVIPLQGGKLKAPCPIVTHIFDDRGIVFNPNEINSKEGKYELVVADEFLENKMEVSSDLHYEFNDASELYQAIYRQSLKSKGLNM